MIVVTAEHLSVSHTEAVNMPCFELLRYVCYVEEVNRQKKAHADKMSKAGRRRN